MRQRVVILGTLIATAIGPTTLTALGRQRDQTSPPASAPSTREELKIPSTEQWLGTVRIPVRVLADSKPLEPGTYRVRLTSRAAEKNVPGQLESLERWVEFVQGGDVKGQALAPVVPARATKEVAEARPPTQGRFRVERLKGNEYVRLWYNLKGDQILIYLPLAPASP